MGAALEAAIMGRNAAMRYATMDAGTIRDL
jgi:hypothetical protein